MLKLDVYNWLANTFKFVFGKGLRRIPLINKIYKIINRLVVPEYIDNINGFRIYLDAEDSLRLSINNGYEPTETELIKALIKPGHQVLDLGANIGYYTLLMSGLVGNDGQVIALEPEPGTFDLLVKNIQANHLANVSCYQLAAAGRSGQIQLTRDPFNNSDHRIIMQDGDVVVRACRLDDIVAPDARIDFIKMDIQGAEGMALEGMLNTIKRSGSIKILTEYWPAGLELSGYGAANYLARLQGLGFELFDVHMLEPYPINSLLEMISGDPKGYTNIICARATPLPH